MLAACRLTVRLSAPVAAARSSTIAAPTEPPPVMYTLLSTTATALAYSVYVEYTNELVDGVNRARNPLTVPLGAGPCTAWNVGKSVAQVDPTTYASPAASTATPRPSSAPLPPRYVAYSKA